MYWLIFMSISIGSPEIFHSSSFFIPTIHQGYGREAGQTRAWQKDGISRSPTDDDARAAWPSTDARYADASFPGGYASSWWLEPATSATAASAVYEFGTATPSTSGIAQR